MAERYIVVLDAGTSSIRCSVFNQNSHVIASRSANWTFTKAHNDSPYSQEFDSTWLWKCIQGLLHRTLKSSGASLDQISAITATSQRQAVVCLDEAGDTVYSGPNLDLRALFEGGAIDEEMGKEVYEVTGHTPSFLMAPAKLRWLQHHRYDAYKQIAVVLPLADWIIHKLSGTISSEPSLAAEVGLLDIATRNWCNELLSTLGVRQNTDVSLVTAGTIVGNVSESVTEETGLPTDAYVVVSGADTQCGLLGMGIIHAGQVGIVAGWSIPLQLVTTKPILSLEARTWASCHLPDNLWTLESSAGDAGNSYRWLANTFYTEVNNPYEKMELEARQIPPGAEGALAYLGPSLMNMSHIGMRQGGFIFPVPMTVTEISRGHFIRAALESIAYAVRANLEQIEELSDSNISIIAVGGGMTRTDTWIKILTNVLGRPIRLPPTTEISSMGAYLSAATALGEFSSLEHASTSMIPRLKTIEPNQSVVSEYEELYQYWNDTSNRLRCFPI